MQPSRRVRETSESAISSIAHLAGPDVASMAQGCVYWRPPAAALARAADTVAAPEMHSYGAVLGRDALQKLIKEKLRTRNGIEGKEVMITPGGNEAWTSVLMTLTDPGDEAIIFEPYYFNAKMALELLNVRPVIAKCHADLTPDLTTLPFSDKTRVVILVNPSNPTGFVWPAEALKRLQRICEERKVWLVSDEAYEDFLWDGAKHYSPLGNNVLNLYTMSKSYGMHGWRIGYCAYPPHLRSALTKVQDTVIINACQFSQALATECLRDHLDYPAQHLVPLAENRRIVWDAVSAVSKETVKTSGAFYFFVKLPDTVGSRTDVEVCEYLAKKHRVLVTAGESFGRRGYIRVSYGNAPPEVCSESAMRLKRGLEALARGEF